MMFCAKDVAEALGYNNPLKAVRSYVAHEDKGVNKMVTPGGIQPTIFINESGLYSLILSSKLESAKRFKHWVTEQAAEYQTS
ncbi:MAG: Bro-N domain-containing protein [Bacteroidaceae bacterium]|nr:Bro-N domain-containing protein [Bacteroidaceae bacterium]